MAKMIETIKIEIDTKKMEKDFDLLTEKVIARIRKELSGFVRKDELPRLIKRHSTLRGR